MRSATLVLTLILGPTCFGSENEDAVQTLAKEFGIKLTHEFKKEPPRFPEGPLTRGDALPSDAGAAAPLFLSLLQSWPKSLVKKIGLETVVISRELRVGSYRSWAVAHPERHTLFVSVDLLKESHLHAILLHNLFRFVDAADPQRKADDEAWSRINPEGFRYLGEERRSEENPAAFEMGEAQPGFVNELSTSTIENDKAEVFAHLVLDGTAIETRAAADRRVAAKVELMKGRLIRLSPELAEQPSNKGVPQPPPGSKKSPSGGGPHGGKTVASRGGGGDPTRMPSESSPDRPPSQGDPIQGVPIGTDPGGRPTREEPKPTEDTKPNEEASPSETIPEFPGLKEPRTEGPPPYTPSNPPWFGGDSYYDSPGQTESDGFLPGTLKLLGGKLLWDAFNAVGSDHPEAIGYFLNQLKDPKYWLTLAMATLAKQFSSSGGGGTSGKLQQLLEFLRD